MRPDIQQIRADLSESLRACLNRLDLTEWHQQSLGKNGRLTNIAKTLGQLPVEERAQLGKQINSLKKELTDNFDNRQQEIIQEEIAQRIEQDRVDLTSSSKNISPGTVHPTNKTLAEIYEVFREMGFQVYDAPEVETDERNFQLLNIPEFHPARDMWDTFWLDSKTVLRTHTSPGQIRAMREKAGNALRVILPGKCYRFEQITPRSEHQFFQVEGLVIGKKISMSNLIQTIQECVSKLYGEHRKIRLRGSYFPFTEPSVEIDMDCLLCESSGCRVCKYTSWLEIAGAGMVHPVVLKNGGYDPQEWSGFAFGMGVERPTMLRHGIQDIRYFYSNDLRFVSCF
jgi:phenylalanyl-tRNA synthetase alpha chain